MIPISKYPSISDTKNRVSMIPWYQYPIRSDTRKKVSKQTMRCWGSCCTTARPVPLTQAQKPLASLIWYHLVYFRVISSSLCLKDCQSSFDWHLALYKSIQPTVKTWIHLSHCQPQRLCLTRVLNGFDAFCLHVALLALAFAIWSIPFFSISVALTHDCPSSRSHPTKVEKSSLSMTFWRCVRIVVKISRTIFSIRVQPKTGRNDVDKQPSKQDLRWMISSFFRGQYLSNTSGTHIIWTHTSHAHTHIHIHTTRLHFHHFGLALLGKGWDGVFKGYNEDI